MPTDLLESLTQFGVAGLMGALWVWERMLSRRREQQLNDTHARLMRERDALRVLIRLVRRNTEAIERFERTQEQLTDLLKSALGMRRHAAAVAEPAAATTASTPTPAL